MRTNVRKKYIFYIFLIWIFLSAFYYAGNLLSGNVIAERSAGTEFKLLKYVIAAFISVLIFLTFKPRSLLIIYGCLASILAFLLTLEFAGTDVLYARDLTVVIFSFVGFSYLSANLTGTEVNALVKAIAVSAIFVSVVSFFEYFYMEPILGDYWRQTGGFRSISTLLNPNNLGLYLGAAFIIIVIHNSFSFAFKFISIPLIFVSLLMSGSRTAVVSILFALFFGTIFNGKGAISKSRVVKWLAFYVCLLILFIFITTFDLYEFSGRTVDMETASIRIEKYLEYIFEVDSSYFLPDYNLSRINMVSESSYFHFFNSYGLILAGVLLLVLLSIYKLSKLFNSSPISDSWILIVLCVYYITASFFENVLMSFPNNQLFFIALGGIISAGGRIQVSQYPIIEADPAFKHF